MRTARPLLGHPRRVGAPRVRVALTLLHGRQLASRVLEVLLDGSEDLELLGDLGDLHLGRHGSRRKKLEATSKAWSERLDPKGLGEKPANPLRVECSPEKIRICISKISNVTKSQPINTNIRHHAHGT